MRFCFIIQGEGMGHSTQAIRLGEILESHGHDIISVFAGISLQRNPQEHLKQVFGEKLNFFRSPDFIRSKNLRGIQLWQSVVYNLIRSPVFIKSIFQIKNRINREQPDIILNFYDMLGGIAFSLSEKRSRFYAISHHFSFESQDFPEPERFRLQKRLLKLHNRLCSLKADKRLALALSSGSDFNNSKTVPPLIRKDILDSQTSSNGPVLVYLLNGGLAVELLPLFRKYDKVKFKIFMRDSLNPEIFPFNVEILPPDYKSFGYELRACRAVITTAGFETVTEAAFLGKPVFLIPSENHYEQHGNMADAMKAGLALSYFSFDPEHLIPLLHKDFRRWCLDAEKIYPELFEH